MNTKIYIYSPVDWFEAWDWRNQDTTGIGGSETAHVELAWRLARRGWDVVSYAPIPDGCPSEDRGVKWEHCKNADLSAPGLWINFRKPEDVAKMPADDDQTIWVICEDVDYPNQWADEVCEKVDMVFGLCPDHCEYLIQSHPKLKGKVGLLTNGIRCDLYRQIRDEGLPERNPKRLMYSSSPDRGLLTLLKIFRRARERVSDLELHTYYGLDRIYEFEKVGEHRFIPFLEEIEYELKQPNVYRHDRVDQKTLYRDWFRSGIWCYPCVLDTSGNQFSETSCITSMEAQAFGAIPIVTPHWALRTNVKHGVFISGNANQDLLARARYVEAVVSVATNPDVAEQIRSNMMRFGQHYFNWDRMVDAVETMLVRKKMELPEEYDAVWWGQFMFQHKHSEGKILNVGCNNDGSNFKGRGAINVDVVKGRDVVTDRNIPADIIADARDLPKNLYNCFDTVILGDILEHFTKDTDIHMALRQAKSTLRDNGKIIVTVPEDYRGLEHQHPGAKPGEYTDGVCHYHWRPCTKDMVLGWIRDAGLKVETIQELDYTEMSGVGVVVR